MTTDKHMASRSEPIAADGIQHKKSDRGLAKVFPAPDDVDAAHPAKSRPDAHPTIIEDDEHGPRDARHPS